MHALWGLQQQGYEFELKGGTSLSKGFKIIDRFSEDLDIHINPDPKYKLTSRTKLIEVGFDTIPNAPIDISSWAFEKA